MIRIAKTNGVVRLPKAKNVLGGKLEVCSKSPMTGFFRDPEAWECLRKEVVAPLVAQPEREGPIRVWVPGTATGEEAYSVAMLFIETMEALNRVRPLQVFASDVNGDALAFARGGTYPVSIASHLAPERLQRFFVEVKDDHHYQIAKQVRMELEEVLQLLRR